MLKTYLQTLTQLTERINPTDPDTQKTQKIAGRMMTFLNLSLGRVCILKRATLSWNHQRRIEKSRAADSNLVFVLEVISRRAGKLGWKSKSQTTLKELSASRASKALVRP